MNDTSPEYLTWTDPDRSLTVRISHTVIRKLNVEVMKGFGVTKRRGTELGGILLGQKTAFPDIVTVEDCEPVPCEYAYGPSYVLSAGDMARFAEAVAIARDSAIGYFRSHTRDGLSLDAADAELFREFFGSGGHIALIAKPFATTPPAASLYFPHAGELRANEETFQFSLSPSTEKIVVEKTPVPVPQALRNSGPPPIAAAVSLPVPSPVAPPTATERLPAASVPLTAPAPSVEAASDKPVAAAVVPRETGFLTVLLAILFTAAAMLTGFVAGFQLAGGLITLTPTLALRAPDETASWQLGLRTDQAGDRIRLTWPRDSPAVRNATAGMLSIAEAGNSYVVNLTGAEVRYGTILHSATATDVRFRLDIALPGERTVSETLDWHK
ncbi:MAG: hypothetical protein H7039_24125 [Bryobacteraceae bacterium]|nr:hypothetical protein [Bryobacteraceae bacterium]